MAIDYFDQRFFPERKDFDPLQPMGAPEKAGNEISPIERKDGTITNPVDIDPSGAGANVAVAPMRRLVEIIPPQHPPIKLT